MESRAAFSLWTAKSDGRNTEGRQQSEHDEVLNRNRWPFKISERPVIGGWCELLCPEIERHAFFRGQPFDARPDHHNCRQHVLLGPHVNRGIVFEDTFEHPGEFLNVPFFSIVVVEDHETIVLKP